MPEAMTITHPNDYNCAGNGPKKILLYYLALFTSYHCIRVSHIEIRRIHSEEPRKVGKCFRDALECLKRVQKISAGFLALAKLLEHRGVFRVPIEFK